MPNEEIFTELTEESVATRPNGIYVLKEGLCTGKIYEAGSYFNLRKVKDKKELTVQESLLRLAKFLQNFNYYIICRSNTEGKRRYHIVSNFALLDNPKQLSLEDAVSMYNYGVFSKRKEDPSHILTYSWPTSHVKNSVRCIREAFTDKIDNRPLTLQRCRKSPEGLKV